MENLQLESTDDTPAVILSKGEEIFKISGRSLPEDVVTFFEPIMAWIKEYSLNPNPSTDFVFKLDYFNTASSKLILDLLNALKNIKGCRIIWYTYEDDEEVLDAGKEFSEQVDIPFEFRKV
ncbi:MAG TPA: DUF1987 domain-containing protein [Candidatus Cloacimonadota bacterium]|nr:DUF1987 domain-containing protein [Candidatus Cloacimonadota bacterium]